MLTALMDALAFLAAGLLIATHVWSIRADRPRPAHAPGPGRQLLERPATSYTRRRR